MTAEWSVNRYKVTLDFNDSTAGNGSTKATSDFGTVENGKVELYVTYGTTYGAMYTNATVTAEEVSKALESIKVTRTGYTFVGFYTERTALKGEVTGTKVVDATAFATADDSTTIYAYWTANTNTKYTVKHYKANVGVYGEFTEANCTLVEKDTDVKYGTTDSVVTPATKTYDGFESPTAQSLTITAEGNAVLNYYYARKEYTFTLEAGVGIATVSATGTGVKNATTEEENAQAYTVQYGAKVALTATAKTGYSVANFTGVGVTVSDLTLNTEKTNMSANFTMPASEVQVTANATANRYALTLDVNNTEVTSANEKAQVVDGKITLYGQYDGTYGTLYTAAEGGEEVTLASLGLTREGNAFAGWYTTKIEADASTTGATAITALTAFKETTASTIYAYWTINTYTLTVKYKYSSKEGAASADVTRTVKYGASESVVSPTLPGYSVDKATATIDNMPAKDTEIVVTYTPITYTAKYELAGGEIKTAGTTSFTIEDVITFAVAEKSGYAFVNWTVTSESEGSWTKGTAYTSATAPAEMYGNVTLTAEWTANTSTTYTVNVHKENADNAEYSKVDTIVRHDGTTDEKLVVTSDTTTVTINNVTYSFDGFTFDETKTGDIAKVVTADGKTAVDIYFTRNTYTLSVEKQEGIVSVDVKVSDAAFTSGSEVKYEAKVEITVTVAEGYTWNNFAVAGTEPTGFDETKTSQTVTMGLGDVTLTAQATINEYTLTINPNGGLYGASAEAVTVKQNYNTTYTLLTPTRTGYTFTGWTKSEGFKGTLDGTTYTFKAGNDTLTAEWKANRYALNLNLNDVTFTNGTTLASTTVVTNEGNALEVVNGVITLYATYDSDYTTLFTSVDGTDYVRFADLTAEKLVRDGYTFAKFASTTEGADEITSDNKCITTLATTIYAIWTADKFVLTVEKNLPELDVIVVGAEAVEGENNKYTVVFDTTIKLTATVYAGYHFGNWSVGGVSVSTEMSADYAYTTNGDVTILATVVANEYTITYNPNGGEGTIGSVKATYAEDVVLSDGTGFSKIGYTLVGWRLDKAVYKVGATVRSLTDEENGTVELFAEWKANEYTVKFDTNKGSAVEDLTATYDVAVEITGETTRAGYDFAGWSTTNGDKADAEEITSLGEYEDITACLIGEGKNAGIYFMADKYYAFNLTAQKEDVTIYAIWVVGAAKYKVEYYLEGLDGQYYLDTEIAEEGLSLDATYTKMISSVTGTAVEIEQVTYTGFTVDLDNENTILSGAVNGDSSLVLKLYYTRNEYTVEFTTPDKGVKSVSGNGTYKFNRDVNIAVEPSAGYRFDNMTCGELVVKETAYSFKIAQNMTFVVNVTALEFKYNVRFNFETLDGTGYETKESTPDEILTATVDTVVTYDMVKDVLAEVAGFTFKNIDTDVENVTVKPVDNETIVNVYYSRDTYTLTLQLTKGVESLSAEADGYYVTEIVDDVPANSKQYTVRFEAKVKLFVSISSGYEFNGWSSDKVVKQADETYAVESMPAQNLTVYAQANTVKVNFTVRYYLEKMNSTGGTDLENDYEERLDLDETKQGFTDSEIEDVDSLNLRKITGFTYSTFTNGTIILGNGNTVLNVYYLRDTIDINISMTEGVAKVGVSVNDESGYKISEEFTAAGKVTVKFGARVIFTYELANAGYKWIGFTGGVKTDTTGENTTYYVDAETVDFDIVATAENNKYTITFYGNGGEAGEEENVVTELTQEATYNRNITLTKNTFARVGYIYSGWATTAEGTEVEYKDNATFNYLLIGDLELYAIWTPITYNIEYNSNGGNGTMTGHTDVVYDTKVVLNENEFDRTGFTFIGWSLYENATEFVNVENDTTSGIYFNGTEYSAFNLTDTNTTVVVYAIWSENGYTLKYNSNYSSVVKDAENDISDVENYKYTAEVTIKDASTLKFAVVGYNFVGWTLNADGTGSMLRANDVVDRMTAVDGEEIVLFAVWSPITYTITFNANTGNGEMTDITATYDQEVVLPENTFTKTGYTFGGWTYVDDNDAEISVADKATIKNLTAKDGHTVELKAVWNLITYTITYKANAGTFDESLTLNEQGDYEFAFTINDQIALIGSDKLTKTGYSLVGYALSEQEGNWADKFVGDITLNTLRDTLTLDAGIYGNVTLTAKWVVNKYTLTINYQYENSDVAAPTVTNEVEYMADYSVESPSIVGYTPSIDVVSGKMDSVNGKTILVIYTANTYKVTLDLNDSEGSSRANADYSEVTVTYDKTYNDATNEVTEDKGLPTPTRLGYTFAGWYMEETFVTLVSGTDTVKIVENTTFYARWTAKEDTKFVVTFKFESLDGTAYVPDAGLHEDVNGTGATDAEITEEMVLALLGETYPTIAGYVFKNVELTTIKADGTSVVVVNYNRAYFDLTLTKGSGVGTFEATTKETAEDDFYIKANGEGKYLVRFGATVVLTLGEMADEGYEFVGYASEKVTPVENKFIMVAEAVSVHAETKAKTFTITFYGNGGTTADNKTTYTQSGEDVVYKAIVRLAANTFAKEGYRFYGWADSEEKANAIQRDYANEANFTLNSYVANVDLYAVWRPEGYDLTLTGDAGIDVSKVTVVVNGTKIENEEKMLVYYNDTVRIYYTFTENEVVTNAVNGGYAFAGYTVNGVDAETVTTYCEFVLHGNTNVELKSTPRDDTRFKVVYEIKDLEGDTYTTVEEKLVENGTTDKVVTLEYLTNLNLIKTFEGYTYASYADQDNNETVAIRYGNDTAEGFATTIHIKYARYHYSLVMNSTDGVQSFEPQEKIKDTITIFGDGYRVIYGTPFNISLVMHKGYTFRDFTVVAHFALQGSVSLGEGTEWTLEAKDDGYYYGNKKVLGLTLDAETGLYVVEAMPAYDITITTNTLANSYKVIYHRNRNAEDETKHEETYEFNTDFSIRNINTLAWNKPGYVFLGWANSLENAELGNLAYTFADDKDLVAGKYLTDENIELWAVWEAGDSEYTTEYYFENLDGTFSIDASRTKVKSAKTDTTATYENVEVKGYELDAENANNILSGNVEPDKGLTLKVYYKRIWYTLKLYIDTGIKSASATSDYIRDAQFNDATSTYTAEVKFGATVTIKKEVKDGYDFVKFEETTLTNTSITDGILTMPIDDITIKLITSAKTYKITFVGNGGSYVEDEQEITSYTQDYVYLTSAALTTNKFKRAGYIFLGWNINGSDAITEDNAIFTYNVTKDIEAVAKWQAEANTKYTANFYTQKIDGTYQLLKSVELTGETDTEITDEMVQAAFELLDNVDGKVIEHAGYIFKGIRETEKTIHGDGSTIISVDYDLAKFDATFDISQKTEDGSSEDLAGVESVEFVYASTNGDVKATVKNKDVKAVEYTSTMKIKVTALAGYKFEKIVITGTQLFREFTADDVDEEGYITYNMPAYAITIKVVVEPNTFAITYHKNFKEDTSISTQMVKYLEKNVVLNGAFTEKGYTLLGWATESTSTTVVYAVNATIETFTETKNIDLYAVWKANTYNVKYNANTAEGKIEDTIATYDEITEIADASAFTKTGYKFNIWTTDVSKTDVVVTVGSKADITAAGIYYATAEDKYYVYNVVDGTENNDVITLYATWTPITYTIKLAYAEDSEVTQAAGTYTYDKAGTLPSFNSTAWTNEGYEFSGWYYYNEDGERELVNCTASETPEILNLTATDGKEITFYAVWGKGATTFTIRILFETLDGNFSEVESQNPNEPNYVDVRDCAIETDTEITNEYAFNEYIAGTDYENYIGFVIDPTYKETVKVLGDHTTIIRLHYVRRYYSLVVNKGENVKSVSISTQTSKYTYDQTTNSYSVKYGDKVTLSLIEEEGYGNGYFVLNANESVEEAKLEADGVTLFMKGLFNTASGKTRIVVDSFAIANENTRYKIYVYKQTVNMDYPETPTYEDFLTGKTGNTINVDAVVEYIEGKTTYDFTGFEFATSEFAGGSEIAGNGSTIVKLYYTRNSYKLSVNVTNVKAFAEAAVDGTYIYEKATTLTFKTNKGYSLNKDTGIVITNAEGTTLDDVPFTTSELENEDGTKTITVMLTMPSKDITVKVMPEVNTHTKYTVVHKFQTKAMTSEYVEDENYPAKEYFGETDHLLTVEEIETYTVVGFEVDYCTAEEETYIAGDGSTVVYVYYNRTVATMTIEIEDEMSGLVSDSFMVKIAGQIASMTETMKWTVGYEQEIQVSFNISEGFTFTGYTVNGELQTDNVVGNKLTYTMGTSDITVKITILARENTPYKVRYFKEELKENTSDETTWAEVFTENLTGRTHKYFLPEDIKGRFVDNVADMGGYVEGMFTGFDYSHYTATMYGQDATAEVRIAGDGSTIINIYYTRKLITITIDYNDSQIESVSGAGNYAYGSTVTISAVVKPGYKFDHWVINGEIVEESENYTFTLDKEVDIQVVVKSEVGEAKYKVEHYFEVLGEKYDKRYEETFTGVTESEIDISTLIKSEDGYEYIRSESPDTYVVEGDGSTVVRLYYNLVTVEFTVTYTSGIRNVTVEGYNGSSDITQVSYDVESKTYTYRAKYTKKLSLSVQLETGWDLFGWVLNNNARPEAGSNETRGYLFDVRAENFSLKAMAMVKQVTIKFNPNNGSSEIVDMFASYGSTINLRENTFKNGNKKFLGWALSSDGEVAYTDGDTLTIDFEDDLVLYAVWQEQKSDNMMLFIIIGIILLLILIIIIIILIIRKKQKEKSKIMSKQ